MIIKVKTVVFCENFMCTDIMHQFLFIAFTFDLIYVAIEIANDDNERYRSSLTNKQK